MLQWLSVNWINLVLIAGVVLLVGWIIRGMIRDRKAGKHNCGGNCAACGACGGCAGCSACATQSGSAASHPNKNTKQTA